MEVEGEAEAEAPEEDFITCGRFPRRVDNKLTVYVDTSIEAPPSFLPQRKYCDITGLEVRPGSVMCTTSVDLPAQAPYTDPQSGLRYHDKSVYEVIRGLVRELSHIHLLDISSSTPECECGQGISIRERCKPNRPLMSAKYRLCGGYGPVGIFAARLAC
jgi:hypothetical protein